MKLLEYRDRVASEFAYIANGLEFINEPEYLKSVANEIVAYSLSRLFSYRDDVSFGYNNINNYIAGKIRNSKKIHKEGDLFKANLRRFERREKRVREFSDGFAKYLADNGFKSSYSSYKERNRSGRMYDRANLSFIYDSRKWEAKFILYDYIVEDRICNSHKVSNEQFNDAYLGYNKIYQEAKQTENKEEYIFKWINLYRAETAFHLSLIPKIVDFIVDKKDVDLIYPHLSAIWGTRFIEDKYVLELDNDLRKEKHICEAFQVLRYDKYIEPVFSSKNQADLNMIMAQIDKERILESIAVIFSEYRFQNLFEMIRTGEETSIEDVYDFCKNHYPIIENYTPVDFYMEDNKNKFDNNKIQCARKVILNLLKPHELKKIIKTK